MNLGFEIVLVTKVAVIWTSFSSPDDDDVIILVVTFFLCAFVRSFFCVALSFFFPKSKSKHELFRVLVVKP